MMRCSRARRFTALAGGYPVGRVVLGAGLALPHLALQPAANPISASVVRVRLALARRRGHHGVVRRRELATAPTGGVARDSEVFLRCNRQKPESAARRGSAVPAVVATPLPDPPRASRARDQHQASSPAPGVQ